MIPGIYKNRKSLPARLISLMLVFFMISSSAISQNTESQAAKQFAADFFKARQQNTSRLKSAVADFELTQSYQSSQNANTPLFVFQKEGKGFAMVAQNYGNYIVVGYSDESVFQPDSVPPQLRALMDYYEDSLQFVHPAPETLGAGIPVVPALLDEHGIRLNQYMHPEVGGSVTGCMATAMTQIMLFHTVERNTPVKGYGSHCYSHPVYGELCADFENTSYNSNELLSYHVAIALNMRFTPGGSSPPPGIDVIGNFEKYFNYFVADGIRTNFYLKNELENRRPVYSTLSGYPENHAVVIDGYDDRDYFHLNFGWGGHFNGYFLMNIGAWYGTGNAGEKYYSDFAKIYLLAPTPLAVSEQDSLALIAVHNALGGYEATHWDLTKSVWKWPGVLVMNDRVIRLTVESAIPPATATSIPPEIGNLTALQELNLYGCFNGTIPSTITQLTDLKQLNIANKEVYVAPTLYKGNLKSSLPTDIDKLTQLEWLSVSNTLEGTIPASIGNLSNLKLLYINQDTLHFGKGDLTGTIPAEIGNLSQLQQLHISNQKLSGNLPPTIDNLSGIRELDFSDNLLSGSLPALNLPNIEYLNLNNNLFSEFSEADGNCPNLKEIQLQNNQITGSIPSWYGNLTKLKSLNISDNLIDALPAEIGNLIELEVLRADNNLIKALPDGLALIINLQHLSARNNQIGYIPGNLGQSRSLVTLDLSANRITSIPAELGNCPDLYQVFLNNNKIDSIPASFANIREEATVLLQENEMQGKIPVKLLTAETENNKHVRLDSNRFVFNDIPMSDELKFGVRNQKNKALKKQVYKVQAGDAISIDIRTISNLSHPGNEYYWLPYPELTTASIKDERFSGIENNPVLQLVIDEKNVGDKYYCKIFNPASPSFSFNYNGTTVSSPCMEYLNTDIVEFTLATDEDIIAEKFDDAFVTSLESLPDKTISDGTITLVPPVKIMRGVIEWEASSDGITWEKVSESMERADLKANVKAVSNDMLVLTPKNTAYYRCSLNEASCDPLYSDKLKVSALGNILFDEVINVAEETRVISVDSIEIVVPVNFHESDFRLTITKIENMPSVPDSVKAGSAYDVSVSFAETFELPLLIKLKNIDKTTISDNEIDNFKAVYYDDKNREWKYFDHAHISLKDSTIAFTTHHLTKLSWWREEKAIWGYTDVYERNNIRVFYKDGETDFMKYGYARKQKPQAWHIAEIPLLVQDITEYLPTVMAKYKSLGLEVPDGKFSVYVKQMDDAGCVGLLGMMNGYMLIDATMSNPVELLQVLAHEYMHYTQDYYISANPGNSFWMEAHATLSDRIVWNDKEVPLCEPEELLQSGRTSNISIFNFLSNSWDYWDKSLATNNLLGEIHYNYLAGNFLHYMRSEREKSEKLEPATLLKETSWFGSWRTYLGSYTSNHLNAILGDEYEEYVKYILSGKNEKFTLLNKKGNPYAYLQDPKNNGVFTHPVSYRFKEGDEMVQKDEIDIKVPYMASKIVLLENTNPDTMLLVNYKRNHNLDYDHRVYHASYDFQKQEITFVNISDSAEYNFLLDPRDKENALTGFRNYSFLLLINKEYIGASGLIPDFDASFELTAMPVLNIDRIGMLTIYNGSSPVLHTFNNKQDNILTGSPEPAFLQNVTEFNVRMFTENTSKRMLDNRTYQIKIQYTLVIDQGQIKGMPTMKDSTIYIQTIDHDVISGNIKITELEQKFHQLHTFIEFIQGTDGDVEERTVYNKYTDQIEERTKTWWLNEVMSFIRPPAEAAVWEEAYGKNILLFETGNTSETRQMAAKIDATERILRFNTSGVLTSEVNSNYLETDYSSPNLILRMIVQTGGK